MTLTARERAWISKGEAARFVTAVVLLVALDLFTKTAASRWLEGAVDLRLIELRIGYNSGVAFSLGDRLPPAVVLAGTAIVTLGIGAYALLVEPPLNRWSRWGYALVLGGAVGNLVDRARDGLVTDFLYTGWFPTFNLADILITVGAATMLWGSLAGTADGEPIPSVDRNSRQ